MKFPQFLPCLVIFLLFSCSKSVEPPSVTDPDGDGGKDDDLPTLLFSVQISEEELAVENRSIWLMVHDFEGKLLSIAKAVPGENELYADHAFAGPDIYFSFGYITNSESEQRINIKTYASGIGGKRLYRPFFIPTFLDSNNTMEVQIAFAPGTNPGVYNPYTAFGDIYGLGSTMVANDIQNSEVRYADEANMVILRKSDNPGYDGKKEGYYYYIFDPNTVVSPLILEDSDFEALAESVKLNIPEDGLENFIFNREGYQNESDFKNYRRHYLYKLSNPAYSGYIDLPIIPGLELYENFASYKKGPYTYNFRSFGNNMDIDTPNWSLDYLVQEDGVKITSQNQGDHYFMDFHKSETLNGKSKTYFWQYFSDASKTETHVPRLSLPEEIVLELGADFYTKEDVPNFRRLSISDNELNANYDEFLKETFGITNKTDRDLGYGKSMSIVF